MDNGAELRLPRHGIISYESKICNERAYLGDRFNLSGMSSLMIKHFYGEMKPEFPRFLADVLSRARSLTKVTLGEESDCDYLELKQVTDLFGELFPR